VPTAASLVVFDVNETLSDLSPLEEVFAGIGLPGQARLWFASVLRDGIGLTTAGAAAPFATIGTEQVHALLAAAGAGNAPADAAERVTGAFASLSVHADVVPGVRALRAAGLRLVTLSNGAASVGEGLLDGAGIRGEFEAVLSVEGAGAWKPAAAAYRWACRSCGVEPEAAVLVAVHPWDLDGAARAGLRTAWLDRRGGHWPAYATRPDHTASSLPELAVALRG
jgi:2-haloacid dehalogenase